MLKRYEKSWLSPVNFTAPRKRSAKKRKSSKTVVLDPSPIESCNPTGLRSIADYLHLQPAVDLLGSHQAKEVLVCMYNANQKGINKQWQESGVCGEVFARAR